MRVILVGGGTGGSVFTLLAIAKELPEAEFLFVGTKDGPEKTIVPYPFKVITAGKLRRYFDLRNFTDIFKIITGFFQAIKIIRQFRPDVIIGTGSYVQVPMIWAGWFLNIPSLVHQQDIRPGLANRLVRHCMTKFTSASEIGNPVRDLRVNSYELLVTNKKPIVLITGGGTGALNLNKLVSPQLCNFAQVIHLTGLRKNLNLFQHPDYHPYEFLKEEMAEALMRADLVVSRAGFSTLYELAALGKPTIIVPIPSTHQEENARYFSQVAIVLKQDELTPEKLTQIIKETLENKDKLKDLSSKIKTLFKPNAAEKIADQVREIARRS